MTWELRKLLPGHFWQTREGCKTIVLELPVADLIDGVTSKERENATYGPLREEIRGGMELAWRDVNFVHEQSGRRACFRVCVARRGSIHCLITYEFWSRDRSRPDEIWQTVLETLVLDRVVRDPTRGPSPESH